MAKRKQPEPTRKIPAFGGPHDGAVMELPLEGTLVLIPVPGTDLVDKVTGKTSWEMHRYEIHDTPAGQQLHYAGQPRI